MKNFESWQLCPKCKGSKKSIVDGFLSKCDVCDGMAIISNDTGLPPKQRENEKFKYCNFSREIDDLVHG